MTVRVRYKITATVSSTEAEDNDLANQRWEVVCDTFGEGGSWKTTLAPGETNTKLYLGNLSNAKVVVVRTNPKDPTQTPGEIVLRKNTETGEATSVLPMGSSKEAHLLIATDGIIGLWATNNALCDMEVTVVAAGD